ncbi:MAG TPA: efflux RND transporter periplasmic adaptor subunit [Cellvibrionaceae bacterium]|nr:efflux RND transporter periplasmic adaptor subunit [Cellvibrionaceae bacterium]
MNDLYIHPLDARALQSKRRILSLRQLPYLALGFLFCAAAMRLFINTQNANALAEYTAATLERRVLITQAKPGELQRTLALPTTLRGNNESIIYARSTGYEAAWHKGIGDAVQKGDLLAVLDAPEQDQELAQARAQREQIAARADFAKQTLARWETLQVRSALSEQDLAEKRSTLRQVNADLAAADANVKRLEQLQKFRHITAPFNGVLTRCSVEVGDLIANTGKELFAITQIDPLRLTVWVPQAYAANLQLGAQVNVNIAEYPGAKLTATIERIAGGIDPATRARQVDLVLKNPRASLLPGAYAEVSIQLKSDVKTLIAPAASLIVSDQTQRVAIVDEQQKIRFQTVKLGRDLGRDVEILEGISPSDNLVVSPPDQLVAGEQVKTLDWKPARPEQAPPGNKPTGAEKSADSEKNNLTEKKSK